MEYLFGTKADVGTREIQAASSHTQQQQQHRQQQQQRRSRQRLWTNRASTKHPKVVLSISGRRSATDRSNNSPTKTPLLVSPRRTTSPRVSVLCSAHSGKKSGKMMQTMMTIIAPPIQPSPYLSTLRTSLPWSVGFVPTCIVQ